MELLNQSIPSAIIIGPFKVSVEAIRQSLVKKHRALASAVLDRLALRLHQQIQDVSQCSLGLENFLSSLNVSLLCNIVCVSGKYGV